MSLWCSQTQVAASCLGSKYRDDNPRRSIGCFFVINNMTSSSEFFVTLCNDKTAHSVTGSSSAEGRSCLSNVNSVSLTAATHLWPFNDVGYLIHYLIWHRFHNVARNAKIIILIRVYINYQLWCTDYYLFIRYYSPLHVSSLKCSSSGGYSCTHAAYVIVTLYESSWWPVGTQLESELTVGGRLLVGVLRQVYNCILLKMSTWGSKHVEENIILWINNNWCIKLVINI